MTPILAVNMIISLIMGYHTKEMSFKKIPLIIVINILIYYIAYLAFNNFNNLYVNLKNIDNSLLLEIIILSYIGYYLGAYSKIIIKKDRYSR
ncbi:hypothetical protein J3E06_000491 [Methanococcus voltae]|uniref:Uncharacterized protein n=1 Tax=Methanococcus voltae (strain ATCC BAA-1334 / A3) TaxID=456320 RepID=D7DV54_METV3|nr:hypothetical protein [Methanococcus voltae]